MADRMEDVELVPELDDVPPSTGTTAARRSRVARVLRRWWPLPLVAVAGLVAWQAVDSGREQAEVAELRRTDGVLTTAITAPLDATPWGPADGTVQPAQLVPAAGGLLVGPAMPGPDRPVAVVAVDARTGAEAWRATIGDPLEGAGSIGVGCDPDADPASTLWCTVTRTSGGTATTRLSAVDVAVRAVTDTRELSGVASAVVAGDRLVVATSTPEAVVVEGSDLRTGDSPWRSEVPDPFASGGDLGPQLLVDGSHLLLHGGADAWSLDPRRGTVQARGTALHVTRGDLLIDTRDGSSTRLLGVDGSGTATTEGAAAVIEPDDGSAPGVLVLDADGDDGRVLRGVDGESGRQLWERPSDAATRSALVLLDGRLYGTTGSTVWALDPVSGAELWSTDGGDARSSPLMTDGRSLLRVEGEAATGDAVLAAYDLDDGERVWATPLPDGIEQVEARHGRLFGWGGEQVYVLE
jgi:outer membrane protein assembly factor BamB